MNYIQSYILNLAPANSIEEFLKKFVDADLTASLPERLYTQTMYGTGPDDLEEGEGWTAPRWAKKGDICFFMMSVSSLERMSKIRQEIRELGNRIKAVETKNSKASIKAREQRSYLELVIDLDYYDDVTFLYNRLSHALSMFEITYRAFGGKIFAVGKVSSVPIQSKKAYNSGNHWGSNIYCNYEDVLFLEEPVGFSEFKDYVSFSQQGAITPVFGSSFDNIKKLILKKNPKVASFFKGCESSPIPMTKINKSNWLKVTGIHNFGFILEAAFRRYYTDYLLTELKDSGKLFSECQCYNNELFGKIDNVFMIGGKYLATEIKLNQKLEVDLEGQLKKYYNPNRVCLKDDEEITGKDMHKAVLLIDTFGVWLFKRGHLKKIEDLKSIKSSKDIQALKRNLCALLSK